MERKSNRYLLVVAGAVAGFGLSMLCRTELANAQVRATPFRVCVGTTYNFQQGHIYRLWNDGTMDYTNWTTQDGNGVYHFAPWRPAQP